MFNDRYPFFSATSVRMQEHFASLAERRDRDPAAAEIRSSSKSAATTARSSRHVAAAGIRHLGIEPSASVAAGGERRRRQHDCAEFFDAGVGAARSSPSTARPTRSSRPTRCRTSPTSTSVVEGIAILLAPDGTLRHRGSVLGRRRRPDRVRSDLRRARVVLHPVVVVVAVRAAWPRRCSTRCRFDVHGGSMRYLIGRPGSKPPSRARRRSCSIANSASGLHGPETFAGFRDRVHGHRRGADVAACASCKAEGKRVVGYGATSKSTTTINFFGITPDLVEFISDTTPAKQGTFSPARTSRCGRTPNSRRAIRTGRCCSCGITPPKYGPRRQAFARGGGQWIVYVPASRSRDAPGCSGTPAPA